MHEGAKFIARGRKNKKLLAKNNRYKRKADDSMVTSPKKRQSSEKDSEVGTEEGQVECDCRGHAGQEAPEGRGCYRRYGVVQG